MSNPPHGSSGGSPLPPYVAASATASSMYRRSSYASVLTNAQNAGAPPYSLQSSRPSQILNTAPGTSYSAANLPAPESRPIAGNSEADGPGNASSTRSRDSAILAGPLGNPNQVPLLNGSGEKLKAEVTKAPYFIPSYLRGSRYAERLEDAHTTSSRTHYESRTRGSSNPPSLSTSSSSVSLPHKAAPSHRGITHDIIERAPPPTFSEESVAPLPSRWNDADKSNGLDTSPNGLHLRYTGQSKLADDAAAARADHPMPRQCGIYYYEVTVLSKTKEGLIGIGFSGPKVPLSRLPGWEPDSWAYHGDDGFTFQSTSSGKPYGPKYSAGDVIGCGVNFRSGYAFFTKNGNYLGKAFEGIKANIPLYPSVGMKKPNEFLGANFGQTPFVFDIDNMVERERWLIMEEVKQTDVAKLHTPLNAISRPMSERQLIHKLIAQYLAHEGYIDSGHAFAEEVDAENSALASGAVQHVENLTPVDDADAFNRQKIRHYILDGNIDHAIWLTKHHFPKVLRDNENIYFRLRCRKYIEMIKQAVELADYAASTRSRLLLRASNGGRRVHDDYNDIFDHQMELDEQLGATHHRHTSNGTSMHQDSEYSMDTEDDPVAERDKLTEEALKYGAELKAEFDNDPRKEVKRALDDTLALIAYADPRDSPLKWLLEEKERIPVAEELNSAILGAIYPSSILINYWLINLLPRVLLSSSHHGCSRVTMTDQGTTVTSGKSAASALERAVQQTVVLLNELGEDGGPGAFLNINRFLRDGG